MNCREVAPKGATSDMFVNATESAQLGGLAIAVPGEMACFAEAHSKYGRTDWKYLIGLIVELVERNVVITSAMEGPLLTHGENLRNNAIFKAADGTLKRAGDHIRNSRLADTFEQIANDKWAFHKGCQSLLSNIRYIFNIYLIFFYFFPFRKSG